MNFKGFRFYESEIPYLTVCSVYVKYIFVITYLAHIKLLKEVICGLCKTIEVTAGCCLSCIWNDISERYSAKEQSNKKAQSTDDNIYLMNLIAGLDVKKSE